MAKISIKKVPKPNDISNLALWLKADTGVTLNGSSQVISWADQSGNSRNFVNPATIGINNTGLPIVSDGAVFFRRTSRYGDANASILALPSSSLNLTTPYTIFAVVRGSTDYCVIAKSMEGAKRRKLQMAVYGGAIYCTEKEGTEVSYTPIDYFDPTIKRLVVSQFASESFAFMKYNGLLVSTSSGPFDLNLTNTAPVYLGAAPFSAGTGYNAEASLDMYIYEILIYDRAISDIEIRAVESYLGNKYAISSSSLGQNSKLNIKKIIEGFQVSSLSGLSLWLKADAGVAIGGGNHVNTWADQSSNGNNAVGPTMKKPVYVANGINGKPTMSFNGSTELFQINDSNSLDITNCSIYIVLQRNGNGTGNEVTFMKNASDNAENAVYWQTAKLNGGNSNFTVNSIGYPDRNTNVYLGDGLPRIMSFSYDGSGGPTNLNIYVNGIKTAYYNYPTANINTSTGTLQIGGYNASFDNAGEYFNGYISEFIIFNRALTDEENLSVTNYLNSKYATYSSPYVQNGKLRIKTPPPFPIANLFAFWNLNESSGTRYDSSGNGRNLTETFGTVSSTTGKIANCAYFNGTSGGGSTNSRLGSTSFGVNPNSNFSMSVWMKPRSFNGYQHIIGAPFENGFYIGANESNLTFNLFNGSVYGISAPSTAFDTWHHYVFIREGSTLKLYADNVYIGSASITGQSFSGASVFSVGGGEYNEYYFNGDIDALGLWTRALTESEIATLYNGGNGIES